MTVLETSRLILRRITPDDALFIHTLMNDPDFIRNIGDRGLSNQADARSFIEQRMMPSYERYGHGLYCVVLRDTAVPIGICGLLYREALQETDIGYAFLPGFRGQGYALEAATACMDYGRTVLGKSRIVGFTDQANLASARLLEKLGLRYNRQVSFGEGDETGLYD